MRSRTITDTDIESRLEITDNVMRYHEEIIELIALTKIAFDSTTWNVYDYRDNSNIGAMEKFSEAEWKWEFIRRNEIYRRLWIAETHKIKRTMKPSPGKMIQEIFENIYLTDPNLGVLDMRENADKWTSSKREVFPPDFEGRVLFKRYYRPSRIIYSDEFTTVPQFDNELQFYFRFDPTVNFGQQLADLKSHWKGKSRKKATRPRRSVWPEYLRVWDAYADGLSYAEIGNLLRKEQNEQSARDSVRAARGLIRGCASVF